jgi:hypothetical protein
LMKMIEKLSKKMRKHMKEKAGKTKGDKKEAIWQI